MGSFGVVVSDPGADQFAGMGQVAEQGLVKKLVAQPAVEAFDESILHRFARRDAEPLRRHWFEPNGEGHSILCSAQHFRIAFEVSSVPLSLTIIAGLPRRSIKALSSLTTRRPEMDVSGIAVRGTPA